MAGDIHAAMQNSVHTDGVGVDFIDNDVLPCRKYPKSLSQFGTTAAYARMLGNGQKGPIDRGAIDGNLLFAPRLAGVLQ